MKVAATDAEQVSEAKMPKRPDDPKQSRAFIEKAREIGADGKQSRADELIGRLAKVKPEPRKPRKTQTNHG